jgi:hypothetical protein
MSKSKEMFNEMREQEMQDEFLDDEYRFREFQSRERVSSKTQIASNSSVEILKELFESFGEIFKYQETKNQIK